MSRTARSGAKPLVKPIDNHGRWCVHGYYTLCPYAPDRSGRMLVAGADLETEQAEVLVLDAQGGLLDQFGKQKVNPSFWHTGLWQSWSPDSRYVYFQSGSLTEPQVTRRDLETGAEVSVAGDLEGMSPSGEPGVSAPHGMLYAAGYGDGLYKPDQSPVPFQARDQHGLSLISFDPPRRQLVLTTQQVLDEHPDRDRILDAERRLQRELGSNEGLTLMLYCVRWSPDGSRLLFYFGNHNVVKQRNEPRLAYVFTAKRDLTDVKLALDLSFGRRGVHWGWQPDNEHLIGYGSHPEDQSRRCLAEVRFDGTGYRKLSDHDSGGHPSASPTDPDLLVTDEGGLEQGAVVFISRTNGQEIKRVPLAKFKGRTEPPGRNPLRVCHHPVFNHDGSKVLCNCLPDNLATLVEIAPP